MKIKQLFLSFLTQEKEMRDDFKSFITKVYNFTQNNMNLCGKILGGYPALTILAMFGLNVGMTLETLETSLKKYVSDTITDIIVLSKNDLESQLYKLVQKSIDNSIDIRGHRHINLVNFDVENINDSKQVIEADKKSISACDIFVVIS